MKFVIYTYLCKCGGHRSVCGSCFSSSATWITEIEVPWWSLVAGAYICWALLPAHEQLLKNSFIIISTSMTEESAWCSSSSSLFQAAVWWPPIDFLSQRSYCCRILCSWSHYETGFASLEVWATQFWHSSFCGVWFLHPSTGLIFGGRLLGYKVRLCLM